MLTAFFFASVIGVAAEPYVGKEMKLYGKQVAGAVGMRTSRHSLPGRLEVLTADKEESEKEREAARKQTEEGIQRLVKQLEEIDKYLQDMEDSILAVKRRLDVPRKPMLPDEEPKGPKILATAVWRLAGDARGEAQQLVIRTAEDLAVAGGVPADKAKEEAAQQEAVERLAKQFKAGAIDFKKQMVVVATAGTKRTGGYSVEITELAVKDKTLVVKWKLNSPKPGQPVTQAFTHPAAAALVERFEGPVTFDPPAPKGKDKDR